MAGESTLQRKCLTYARSLRIIAHKVDSSSQRGFPDTLFVMPCGAVVFVEFKNPNKRGKLSKLQTHTINKLRENNAIVRVIDDFNEFKKLISEFVKQD